MAGEANPGVESPATGWAQVGGCGAWDAGNSRLSQFAFLLCFGGPALPRRVGSLCEEAAPGRAVCSKRLPGLGTDCKVLQSQNHFNTMSYNTKCKTNNMPYTHAMLYTLS